METKMVRVIRDPLDASLDYLLSLEEARSMLRRGKLFWDIANECYCTPRQRTQLLLSQRVAQTEDRAPSIKSTEEPSMSFEVEVIANDSGECCPVANAA
jgi:hypothetical protein